MWGTDMKNNLGKSCVFGLLSCVSFTAVYAAPLTTSISDTASRFEVISVDTPAIVKGSSGVQTATIKNFGPAGATNTVVEVRGATTTGVSLSSVTWGASNTACTLSANTYSCTVGNVSNGATFNVQITYAVAQNVATATSVQQTTLAVKSDQPNMGSGVGESIHRVWGRPGSTQEAVESYGAFWPGRNKDGACTTLATCGTYSDETTEMLGFWGEKEKNPQGQYVSEGSETDNGDKYYYISAGHRPNPTFETLIDNIVSTPYKTVKFVQTAPDKKINNLRAWEFETYVYIPASVGKVSACVGTSGTMIDDGAYITIQRSTDTVPRVIANNVRDKYDASTPYVVSETITQGGYYKLNYRMVNQNTLAKKDKGEYGPIGMSFSGGPCDNSTLNELLRMGFPTTITIIDKADLAITKTVDKATAKVGDLLTYTLKVWNKGLGTVTNAVVTDNVATDLASVQVVCKAVGTATCPTTINNTTTSNNRSITLGLLPLVGNDENYLEFTVTGLVYKEPTGASISNTATVSLPTGLTDTDTTNNTSTITTTVTKNTPSTSGDSKNQCNGNQSVNLITDTTFYSYNANNILTPKVYTLNPAVVPYSVAYGTGTNGALQLQGKINWSHESARVTGSTLEIYVNGTVYAVLVTPGASTNSVATFTALNGATVTPVSFTAGKYSTEPTIINFTLTLPTTLTASLMSLNVDFKNISPKNSANDAGDDIGFSLNTLNACLKPTVELKKVSTGGTGTFEFESFSNLSASDTYQIQSGEVVTTVAGTAQNVRLKNSSSPVESGVVTPVYANAGQAVLFKEKDHTLYTLRSVSCVDNNASNSGNSALINATLSGNNVTIVQDNIKFGAKLICTVTNEKKAGYVFSGRVLNDNSGTTHVATKAYNAVVDDGEVGISGSRIELQNCSSKEVIASTVTNANGDFSIQTLQEVFDNAQNQVCLVQRNLESYASVSSAKSATVTATVDVEHDLFTVNKNNSSNIYDGFLFGDAQLQLILTQNGQKNIAAGDVVDYPHDIISKSVHQLGGLTSSNLQQPFDQRWQSIIYYDADCNGLVGIGEKPYSTALTSPPLSLPVLPEQKICLVQRVISSTTAKAGDSLTAQFQLEYSQNYAGNTTKATNSVRDITTVGSAGLDLKKRVRTVASCPSTTADITEFVAENRASKNQFLEYEIAYTNSSAKKLVDVVLKDAVPVGTEYQTCTENCELTTGSSLIWSNLGALLPGVKGSVSFCVKVQ